MTSRWSVRSPTALVMYAGQVVEAGRAAEVLRAPVHPYTRALLACRPRRIYRDDGADERVLQPIAGAPPRPFEPVPGCRFAPRCTQVESACLAAAIALDEVAGDRVARCRRWRDFA